MLFRFFLSFLIIVLYCLVNEILALVEIWPDPVDDGRENYPKPTTWSNKHYGQWCRNRTVNRYMQCPMGSAFHYYSCCGETGTECCFRLQPTVVAYLVSIVIVIIISLIFYLLLKLNLICSTTNIIDSNEE
uniref:CX domain-containing protein n=1 Tax=Elaeophora elaphi TaxID=1147741 RepID=A0A0R3RWU3_9BILA